MITIVWLSLGKEKTQCLKRKLCHPNVDQWDIIVQLISSEQQTVVSISEENTNPQNKRRLSELKRLRNWHE